MEISEQGEKLNIGKDLSPAEHHFFLGSSTVFKDETVNTDTLPKLLNDPDFLAFFFTPQGARNALSELQLTSLNLRRAQGLRPQFPLFVSHERWKEFMNFKIKVELPEYNPAKVDEGIPEWQIHLFNEHGKELFLDGKEDVKSDDPYLNVGIDKESRQLTAAFNPHPKQ